MAKNGPPFVSSEGFFVRRSVDADNSCLFTSIGYVLEGQSRVKSQYLRGLIANSVKSMPERFTAVFLGKTNEQYVEWISRSESWGGAIELSILAEYYKTEIAAFDCQSLRLDIYGQDLGFTQRVFLIYDGIHYDALAYAFDSSTASFEDMDVTIFNPLDEVAVTKAKKVAEDAHRKFLYTDTSKFDLRCLSCQTGLVGQGGAIKHAKETGHQNFAEYK